MIDNTKLIFSLPDSWGNDGVTRELCAAMTRHPIWFYDDFIIDYVYGVPEHCVWSGEIPAETTDFLTPKGFVKNKCDYYRKYNKPYCVCMTNYLLKPTDLHNLYANKLLELLNVYGGYVRVASQILADYLVKFSNLKITWADTTDFGNDIYQQIAKINELSKTNIVTLPRTFNNRPELLSQFRYRENLEIVVNDECPDTCPYRRQHADNLCKYHLFEGEEWKCLLDGQYVTGDIHRHIVLRELIPNYVAMGFKRFSLYGINSSAQKLSDACDYFFVKPKYSDDFIDFLNEENMKRMNKVGNE